MRRLVREAGQIARRAVAPGNLPAGDQLVPRIGRAKRKIVRGPGDGGRRPGQSERRRHIERGHRHVRAADAAERVGRRVLEDVDAGRLGNERQVRTGERVDRLAVRGRLQRPDFRHRPRIRDRGDEIDGRPLIHGLIDPRIDDRRRREDRDVHGRRRRARIAGQVGERDVRLMRTERHRVDDEAIAAVGRDRGRRLDRPVEGERRGGASFAGAVEDQRGRRRGRRGGIDLEVGGRRRRSRFDVDGQGRRVPVRVRVEELDGMRTVRERRGRLHGEDRAAREGNDVGAVGGAVDQQRDRRAGGAGGDAGEARRRIARDVVHRGDAGIAAGDEIGRDARRRLSADLEKLDVGSRPSARRRTPQLERTAKTREQTDHVETPDEGRRLVRRDREKSNGGRILALSASPARCRRKSSPQSHREHRASPRGMKRSKKKRRRKQER